MSWDNNIYYNPENYGLETVGVIDWSDGCYQFDYTAVWRTEDGTLYYAEDSGCSCPSPFEGFGAVDELTEITDLNEFQTHLNERSGGNYDGNRNAEVADLMSRIWGQ